MILGIQSQRKSITACNYWIPDQAGNDKIVHILTFYECVTIHN